MSILFVETLEIYIEFLIVQILILGFFLFSVICIDFGYDRVNDLQDKPEGLDVSVLPTGSVAGLPVALHPYGLLTAACPDCSTRVM